MKSVEILDCTLRDGGYLNNWNFGDKVINEVINALIAANVDYIECGFLDKAGGGKSNTKFVNISDIQYILPDNGNFQKFTLMICAKNYNLNLLPHADKAKVKILRYIFKKDDLKTALEECKIILDKGYKLFLNPTFISNYDIKEFISMLDKINKLHIEVFTFVDSTGSFTPCLLENYFKAANEALNKNIKFGFHFHNNLENAFLNVEKIIEYSSQRDLIIDSTIFGIGRGGGNLATELLMNFLNEKYLNKYKSAQILNIISKNILPDTKPSNLHLLSGFFNCHPDYANYLAKNNMRDNAFAIEFFKKMDEKMKDKFDENYLKTILSQVKQKRS